LKNGSVLLNDKKISAHVTPLSNTDQLRIVLLDKADESVSQSQTIITLPDNVTVSSLHVTPRLVHNLTPDVTIIYPNSHTIIATTPYISADATLSLEIDFPKGALDLPVTTLIFGNLANLSLVAWIIIGAIIPAISLFILLLLLGRNYKLRSVKHIKQSVDSPPTSLPPAVVEVLVKGHISARSIAATLVDLARRNYVVIGYKGNDFRFGKHKTFALPFQDKNSNDINAILQAISTVKDKTDIRLFERLILSKIFTSQELIIDKEELEMRIGHRLFSEKIAAAYGEIYKEATKEGLFIENPSTYHYHFKLVGLILFYGGFFGFLIGAIFFPEPKTALLGWVGMLFTSFIIIRISPKLPILSDKGLQQYQRWVLFKNYLSNSTPLFYSEKTKDKFEEYLPYAIALGVEKEWSARFREHPVALPGWFVSPKETLTLEEFDIELFPLIKWVGQNLSFARTPIVD
jgi:hypothetical protein